MKRVRERESEVFEPESGAFKRESGNKHESGNAFESGANPPKSRDIRANLESHQVRKRVP
jgi:hypothetical protein